MVVEDRLRGASLGVQHGPFGDVAVPLDKRRKQAAASDDNLEQLTSRLRDRSVASIVVTDPDGLLIGVLSREDAGAAVVTAQ